jgi:hypothetical protein
VCVISPLAVCLLGPSLRAGSLSFETIGNPGDLAFNQLLGINSALTAAGYFGDFGDGTVVPNNGHTLILPLAFTVENFPGSVQTQVAGINSGSAPTTAGFYVSGSGSNFGFVDQNGVFTSVQNPRTPARGTAVNQLPGVNTME